MGDHNWILGTYFVQVVFCWESFFLKHGVIEAGAKYPACKLPVLWGVPLFHNRNKCFYVIYIGIG